MDTSCPMRVSHCVRLWKWVWMESSSPRWWLRMPTWQLLCAWSASTFWISKTTILRSKGKGFSKQCSLSHTRKSYPLLRYKKESPLTKSSTEPLLLKPNFKPRHEPWSWMPLLHSAPKHSLSSLRRLTLLKAMARIYSARCFQKAGAS